MKIDAAYIQTKPRFMDVDGNLARAEKLIKKVSADLIVLPEFFNTGYNFRSHAEVLRAAETVPAGKTTQMLKKLAAEKNCAIVAGLPERSGGKIYNGAVFVTPRCVETYRKTHLFAAEKKLFSPGNTGFRVFEWKGARIGVMICFDWIFPESARTLALIGADIIAHPANLVLPWCPEAMKTRSLENRVYAITANRVGSERGLKFIGRSQITNPSGQVLHRASGVNEESCVRKLDLSAARNKRLNAYNDIFKDRRRENYYNAAK